MAKCEIKVILGLSAEEADALKTLLGSMSTKAYKDIGMTEEQIEICGEIFRCIPETT